MILKFTHSDDPHDLRDPTAIAGSRRLLGRVVAALLLLLRPRRLGGGGAAVALDRLLVLAVEARRLVALDAA